MNDWRESKKLLVSGCSVTHGAELHHPFMSTENIRRSFSQKLADKLNCQLVNVALSAASNEYIFHSLVDLIANVYLYQEIHSILVVWTSDTRMTWKCNDTTYIIHPSFATALEDVYKKPHVIRDKKSMYISADTNHLAGDLSRSITFFTRHVIDPVELAKKRLHYELCLKTLCDQNNIRLIQCHVSDFEKFGTWSEEGRHPNADEHEKIADVIYKGYY